MREILASEIAEVLPALLAEVAKEGVAIRSNGVPIAYVISPQEFETTRLARAKKALEALDDLSAEMTRNADEQGLGLHELVRDLDRKTLCGVAGTNDLSA
jgi:PHD/YefM family antitoxin component YafN of YafNO toxin-antitoxin module